ncbi:MAG: RNA methyltransferase [Deltaproteobacteria bacterium]|nr:RNA methyltransferase [Deltaproteobacteria bacterium]
MGKDQLLFGRNILKEALSVRAEISKIYFENESSLAFAKDLLQSFKLKKSPEMKHGIPGEISKLGHQGIAFSTPHQFYEMNWNIEKDSYPFILLCNHIEDVQNLGAITRSAAAFGVNMIVHEERRSVRVNAAAVKISAGQAFRMKFLEVANLTPLCKKLTDAGYSVIGLDAGENCTDLFDWNPRFPLALVIGSESSGISKPVQGQLESLVKIPMRAEVESMNAANAASVAMAWVFKFLKN